MKKYIKTFLLVIFMGINFSHSANEKNKPVGPQDSTQNIVGAPGNRDNNLRDAEQANLRIRFIAWIQYLILGTSWWM